MPCSSRAAKSPGAIWALAQARRITRSCAPGSTELKGFLTVGRHRKESGQSLLNEFYILHILL